MLGGIGGRRRRGTTEHEMAGWHHWLYGHGFWWTPGVGDGQGGLACCDSWGREESDTTERLNWNELKHILKHLFSLFLFISTTELLQIFFSSLSIQITNSLNTKKDTFLLFFFPSALYVSWFESLLSYSISVISNFHIRKLPKPWYKTKILLERKDMIIFSR